MEQDFFDKYSKAWKQDAELFGDKVIPPTEEVMERIRQHERQRRSRRMAWMSGMAAMVVVAVSVMLFSRPEAASPAAPVVAAATADKPTAPATEGLGSEAEMAAPQQPTLSGDYALATPTPSTPTPTTAAKPAAAHPHGVASAPGEAHLEVAHLDQYPLGDELVPAILITAQDSASWEWLKTQFALVTETTGTNREAVQFVQRSYQQSDVEHCAPSLGMDTGNYLLGALPLERSVVVIHYESLPDLLDLRGGRPDYAEKDTSLIHQHHRAKERVPKDNEKMPNRHNVIIETPTYYQTVVPNSNNPQQMHR